ncbi:hypothetical protein [Persephonella sp.]
MSNSNLFLWRNAYKKNKKNFISRGDFANVLEFLLKHGISRIGIVNELPVKSLITFIKGRSIHDATDALVYEVYIALQELQEKGVDVEGFLSNHPAVIYEKKRPQYDEEELKKLGLMNFNDILPLNGIIRIGKNFQIEIGNLFLYGYASLELFEVLEGFARSDDKILPFAQGEFIETNTNNIALKSTSGKAFVRLKEEELQKLKEIINGNINSIKPYWDKMKQTIGFV